ncbi:hypothetical protein C2E23DRAFT_275894 [Lenzites betulinus]|nr:hypothetical protein C2E23DRAFT_275894 [Lenzites betulinus]
MNENSEWIPTQDSQPGPSTAAIETSDPNTLLQQWFFSQHDDRSPSSENLAQPNMGPRMDFQYMATSYGYEPWPRYHDYQPDLPKPVRQNEFLPSLPLQGIHQLIPGREVTRQTLSVPSSFLHVASSSYSNAHTSLIPNHFSETPLSPSSTTSYLPAPAHPYLSHGQFPILSLPLPSGSSVTNSTNSPGEASTSSYHSFPSPGVSSYYSLSPAPSPAILASPTRNFPTPVAPSSLPGIPPDSAPQPMFSGASLAPISALRFPLKQTLKCTSKWEESFRETFKVDGVPGVPVREILKDNVVLDGHDERVLERTGARQIRLVIAWPGYEHVGKYIHVQEKGTFITRGRFAKLICTHLSRFMDRAAKSAAQPGHARWAIGRQGITTDKLWLLSVRPAQQNIWLAELEVLP